MSFVFFLSANLNHYRKFFKQNIHNENDKSTKIRNKFFLLQFLNMASTIVVVFFHSLFVFFFSNISFVIVIEESNFQNYNSAIDMVRPAYLLYNICSPKVIKANLQIDVLRAYVYELLLNEKNQNKNIVSLSLSLSSVTQTMTKWMLLLLMLSFSPIQTNVFVCESLWFSKSIMC